MLGLLRGFVPSGHMTGRASERCRARAMMAGLRPFPRRAFGLMLSRGMMQGGEGAGDRKCLLVTSVRLCAQVLTQRSGIEVRASYESGLY